MWMFSIIMLRMLMFDSDHKEHNIAEKERAAMLSVQVQQPTNAPVVPDMDYITLSVLLYAFSLPVLVLVFLETIGVPFVTDQYGWDSDTAMFNTGLFLSFGGLCMMSLFYSAGIIVKKVDERIVMICMGAIPLTIGCFVFLPFQGSQIEMSNCTDSQSLENMAEISAFSENLNYETVPNAISWEIMQRRLSLPVEPMDMAYISSESTSAIECTLGCPQNQNWCTYVPQLELAQLVIACMFVMTGFPMLQSVTLGLYSKVVEGKNQGIWLSLLGVVGSTARIIGPIFVSHVYSERGTYWTFGILTLLMFSLLIILILSYNRLARI